MAVVKNLEKKIILLFVAIVLIIAGWAWALEEIKFDNSITALDFVEIREYEGEDLSSVTDFVENSITGVQEINTKDYRLKINGLVNNPKEFTYDEVLNNHQHYKKVVTLNCVEGWDSTVLWEGVLVKDLINEAGVSSGAKTVIFHANDGYTTSFPIEYILDNDIIIAYNMNGGALIPERGFPFALVAESKWGYKWIRWITKIELSDDADYEGFWEKRGYSNDGDLDKSFLD
ncbi:MAG: molybdopterin-dependent oxidoreductase [Candidatus Marinimicrobia bacterium]|nr:molybdopterin-dependent oxidoreductase [Candidatus Neomarinimicrobiota bacterium]